MSTQTLTRRPTKLSSRKSAPLHLLTGVARRTVAPLSPAPHRPLIPQQPRAVLLAQVEERLLTAAISHHEHSASALDLLLDDLDLMEQARQTGARRALPASDAARHERMEDLLLEAIVRTHPNRDVALARLLGDACGDAALNDSFDDHDEELERARFDMSVDNDFDGLA